MRYLLDTHILLWWLGMPERLPADIRELMQHHPEEVAFSTIAPWEVALKMSKGKLVAPPGLVSGLADSEFACLPVELRHVEALHQLPPLHGDPFDRMLVAQCYRDALTLITADAQLAEYPIAVRLLRYSLS